DIARARSISPSGTLGRPSGKRSNGFCAVYSIICSRVSVNSCAWPIAGISDAATAAAAVSLAGPVIFVASIRALLHGHGYGVSSGNGPVRLNRADSLSAVRGCENGSARRERQRIPLLPLRHRRLQHRARIADVERVRGVAAAARILRTEVRPLAVV